MLIACSAARIFSFGMDGQTFEITILLVVFISLRICITFSLIVMDLVFSTRESTVCLLFRNMQKRLLEILDTKSIFFGDTICPTALCY